MLITRLAPSPTGALHLGNARTFLINWLLARQQRNGKSSCASKTSTARASRRARTNMAIDDLRWLGLDWDQGPVLSIARAPRPMTRPPQSPCSPPAWRIPVFAPGAKPKPPPARRMARIIPMSIPATCRGRFASVAGGNAIRRTSACHSFSRAGSRVLNSVDEFQGARKRSMPAKPRRFCDRQKRWNGCLPTGGGRWMTRRCS
jgi:hypothetical protein